jgi:hypothetical protein
MPLVKRLRWGAKPVRVRIQIDFTGDGSFESVFEQDILEADFYGLKEAAGGEHRLGEKCYYITRKGFMRIPARGQVQR